MVDSNNPPPGGTAELIENSEAQVEQELEDKVGAAIADSLDDEEQPEEQQTKTAEGETDESNAEAEEKEPEKEEEPEAEPEKSPVIKLRDGTEMTLEEVEKGVLRQSDYTRKTQELSSSRKELEAAAQRLIQQDQVAKRDLEFAQAALQALLPKPPDLARLKTDPVGFLEEKEAYNEVMGRLDRVRQGLQNVSGRVQETGRVQTQQEREAELSALAEKVPALATEQARNVFFQEATPIIGKAYGFSPDEIGAFTDHRLIHAMKDLVEYRKIVSSRMEAVRRAKQTATPMKPAARQAPNARVNGAQKANWDRLRQEQSEEAAAAALPDELFN